MTIISFDNIILIDMNEKEHYSSERDRQKERAALVLHPERLRIVAALTGTQLTPAMLAEKLPDISQAGLYRHLKRLEKGGIIEVVETHRVRGTVEKVYTCTSPEKAHFSEEDMRNLDPEMRHNSFAAFLANLYSQFLSVHSAVDTTPELMGKMGYHTLPVDITPEELPQLQKELSEVVRRYSSSDEDTVGSRASEHARGGHASSAASQRERFYLSLTLFPEVHNEHQS